MRILPLALLLCALSASAQKKNIQPSQLPEAALTFLEQNIRGAALHHCYKFTDDGKERFKAVMADDTEIDFDAKGNWTEVDGETHAIPSGFLPAPLLEYLKTNHAGIRIKKAEKETAKLEIELMDGTEMDFDLQGKFLRKSK